MCQKYVQKEIIISGIIIGFKYKKNYFYLKLSVVVVVVVVALGFISPPPAALAAAAFTMLLGTDGVAEGEVGRSES